MDRPPSDRPISIIQASLSTQQPIMRPASTVIGKKTLNVGQRSRYEYSRTVQVPVLVRVPARVLIFGTVSYTAATSTVLVMNVLVIGFRTVRS